MNCTRPTCQQPIRRCPNKERMGSCAYYACTGWIHTATDLHACEDLDGEATPSLLIPLREALKLTGKPKGAVA